MKTPLTQLIERLEAMQASAPHIERNVYTKAIREAKELLPIEENKIKMAFTEGSLDWKYNNATKYFNSTYPQPTKTDSTDNN